MSTPQRDVGWARTLVEPDAVVTAGSVRRGVSLLLDDGRIAAVDRRGALADVEVDVRVGGPGTVALPGMVNAHQHGRPWSTVALGVPDQPLETWIPSLGGLPPSDDHGDTLRLCARLAASGVTTTLHMHGAASADPAEYDASLRAVLGAYAEGGIRGIVAADVRDRGVPVYGTPDGLPPGVPDDVRRRTAGSDRTCPPVDAVLDIVTGIRHDIAAGRLGDVDCVLGPPGPPWCSDDLLRRVARYAREHEVLVTTHVHETAAERAFGLRTYGDGGTFAGLRRVGLLDVPLVVAHGVWLDADERAALATASATVVTNPSSNLRLHAGVCDIRTLLDAGVNVAVGSDNMTLGGREDLLTEVRLARALSRRHEVTDRGLGADAALALATVNGARALGRDDLGDCRVGMMADVVLADLSGRVPSDGAVDLRDAVVAVTSPADIRAVWVGGRPVLDDAAILGNGASEPPPAPDPQAVADARALADATRRWYAGGID